MQCSPEKDIFCLCSTIALSTQLWNEAAVFCRETNQKKQMLALMFLHGQTEAKHGAQKKKRNETNSKSLHQSQQKEVHSYKVY
jgi:hypothetical protein